MLPHPDETMQLHERSLTDEQFEKFEKYKAHHLCMQMRGVREVAPLTRSTVWRGYYNAFQKPLPSKKWRVSN